ncbi:MAG: Na/Pi symporter [Campylobacterota bacterium]|nr:Na/Pi symporter [Campylobacterota bacterium]
MIDSSTLLIIVTASGGLGIFLLGLIIMTNGLQSIAGDALRKAMLRFTKSPYSGAASGAFMTVMLQSSSATTVAAVGFVGAGILTFSQSLGIIFGANIGTTATGWIVAVFGFKFSLGTIVLPFILFGAILKLFAKDRLASIGYAIAGFGLIFVGITMMQEGVAGFENIITPEILPQDSFIGRLQLIGIGIVVTMITQASSAGVAVTLTLLFAGAVNFEQAAALVIGMDVGTTVTAFIATIGGNLNAKRTGYSHVIYNLFSASIAFILITPYVLIWEYISPNALLEHSEIALVAFHTFFNILAVFIILPFTNQFANLIKSIVKEKNNKYNSSIDDILLKEPRLALNGLLQSVNKEYIAILGHINTIIQENPTSSRIDIKELQTALDETHAFVDKIHLHFKDGADWGYLVSIIHILDHLQRLHERCEEEEDRAVSARKTKELDDIVKLLSKTIVDIIHYNETKQWDKAKHSSKKVASFIHKKMHNYRKETANKIARGEINVPEGSDRLEAIRWLRRVSIHIHRINHHLNNAVLSSGK